MVATATVAATEIITMVESAAAKYLRELIAQHAALPARQLARIAYGKHPELWPNDTACLTMVRVKLGQAGKAHRKDVENKAQFRPSRKDTWQSFLPKPDVQLADWSAVQIEGNVKALVLSDIHVPFFDAGAIEVAVEKGIREKVNLVILNGDTVDHYWGSDFVTDPRLRDFPGELEKTLALFTMLRKAFPKARFLLKEGNHEERYRRWMMKKAPELLDVAKFSWEVVFELNKYRIELVKDKRPIRLGKLNVIHGHEYRFQISNPVNPARGFFLRAKTHVLGGHFHQTSQHSEKNLEQKVVTTYSTGCMCDLHPEYAVLNNWNLGFAIVDAAKDGAFHVENLRVINGKCW